MRESPPFHRPSPFCGRGKKRNNGALAKLAACLLPVVLSAALGDKIIAELNGRSIISEKDLSDFQSTQACYGPAANASRQAAFMRLLEASIAEESMRRQHGPKVTDRDIATDAERIDRETRAPEILKCIKSSFGKDRRRYLRVFVKPALIESRFRQFIKDSPSVQALVRKKAEEALLLARRGRSLESIAQDFKIFYSSAVYAETAAEGEDQRAIYETDFIRKYLADIVPGRVASRPAETDFDFKIIRLLHKDGRRFGFELASVPKLNQEEWIQSISKMNLAIFDEGLDQWVRALKGNPRLLGIQFESRK